MNRAEERVATEELPSFLHDGHSEAEAVDNEAYADDLKGEYAESTAFDDAEEEESDPIIAAANMDFGETDFESAERTRRLRSHRAEGHRAGGGVIAIILGIAGWLGAVGLVVAGDKAAQWLDYGITPAVLFIVGTVAILAGCVRRWISDLHNRMVMAGNGTSEDMSSQLAELLDRQSAGDESLGIAQQILLSMQRQDEKTNNLTKAIKMYGKPLMDIANHGTELGVTMAELRTAAEADLAASKAAFARLEEQISTNTVSGEQLSRLEVSIQAVAQRLEDTEVRKSLVRVEDAVKKTHEELEHLSRGDSLDSAVENIQADLKGATSKLHAGIEELRHGSIGELEITVRSIQREVATVATAVSQIQAAIKGEVAAPTPQPTATSQTPASATAPISEATASPEPASAEADSNSYKTGARRSGSKNVLGAIAKLKQMKN